MKEIHTIEQIKKFNMLNNDIELLKRMIKRSPNHYKTIASVIENNILSIDRELQKYDCLIGTKALYKSYITERGEEVTIIKILHFSIDSVVVKVKSSESSFYHVLLRDLVEL